MMLKRLNGPIRNLVLGICFVLLVMACAIIAYMERGWSFGDALYFTILTVFTVGYDEVRPINTPELRAVTIALIVLGCSGTIFLTGALVQFITFNQINELFGNRRMKNQIEELSGHVIICGYGRIGVMLAHELTAARQSFIVLERNEARHAQAIASGFIALLGDASEEDALQKAGIARALALATVLPEDAINVFITLSARSLNENLTIIARGEAAATERKLLQAGANRVVMPTHIGAERIAEIILFPELSSSIQLPKRETLAGLRQLGLELDVIIAETGSAFDGMTIAEIEQSAAHGFLILAVQSPGAAKLESRALNDRVLPGCGVTVVLRSGHQLALEGFRRR